MLEEPPFRRQSSNTTMAPQTAYRRRNNSAPEGRNQTTSIAGGREFQKKPVNSIRSTVNELERYGYVTIYQHKSPVNVTKYKEMIKMVTLTGLLLYRKL
ncbi:MAG: hypothetical protein IJ106_01005 [Parasporobacterium sp.]|nr:hypothetical protein [Parasporobacterium sp.]